MKTIIRRLQNLIKQILEAIAWRKQAIEKLSQFKKPRQPEKDYGFGMWNDHENMINVPDYLRKLRKERRHDI